MTIQVKQMRKTNIQNSEKKADGKKKEHYLTSDKGYRAPWSSTLPEGDCVDHDPDLWFSSDRSEMGRAQKICLGCPIKQECNSIAKTREESGIWGAQYLIRGVPTVPPKIGRRRGSSNINRRAS